MRGRKRAGGDGRRRGCKRSRPCEPLVRSGRRDDHVVLQPDLFGPRPDAGLRGHPPAGADGGVRDDATAAVHARIRDDAVAATDTGAGRNVVLRSTVVLARGRSANDVRRERRLVDVFAWTIHVVIVMVVPAERPAVRDAAVPVPGRRRRSPADVAVTCRADAPGDPRTGVATTGDPRPAVTGQVDPATVVERRPAPRVVRHPDVVGRFAVRPMPRGDVGLEVRTDFFLGGHPDRPVRRVVDPRAVVLEDRLELGERARVRVGVFVALVRTDEDFTRLGGRLLARLLLRRELRCRRRCRRHVRVPVRERRLGLVGSAADAREREPRGDHRDGASPDARSRRALRHERDHPPREMLEHSLLTHSNSRARDRPAKRGEIQRISGSARARWTDELALTGRSHDKPARPPSLELSSVADGPRHDCEATVTFSCPTVRHSR